jgi:Mg-chelatase subunit ChlD
MGIFRRPSNDAVTAESSAVAAVAAESSALPVAVAVTVPTPTVSTPTSTTSELLLSSETQYNVIHNDHQNILVNTKIVAPEEIADEKRENLDLVCVLDISSSMNGASKLDLCKNTLDFVVSQLSPNDRLSLVTFSNNVKTVQKLTKMNEDGKRKFRENVKKVRASGMTNLSGGLLKGVSEVMEQRDDGDAPNKIQSVLLLTDGQANVGIKDKDTLVEILLQSPQQASKKTKSEAEHSILPFSVFTFGFGSDHNVELLKAVSDCANGVYYFIDDLDKVGNAFGDCLGGLLSIVAQNTTLEIMGANGSTVSDVFTDYPNKRKADKTLVVDLGDLYAEEQRNILSSINLNFPPKMFNDVKMDTQVEICKVRLSCTNLLTKKTEAREMGICVSVRPKSIPMSEAEMEENLSIEIHYNRWETSKTMLAADKMSDNHNLKDKAVELLEDRLKKLTALQTKSAARGKESSSAHARELCLLSEMQSDISQCQQTLRNTPSTNMHAKKGFMMNKMNKLGRERNNSYTNYDDAFDDLHSLGSLDERSDSLAASASNFSGNPKKVRSVFETKSKMASKSRASKW